MYELKNELKSCYQNRFLHMENIGTHFSTLDQTSYTYKKNRNCNVCKKQMEFQRFVPC